MTIKSVIATIRFDLRHFGIHRTIYDVMVRVLNQIVFFKILRVISLSCLEREERLPARYQFRRIFLDELASLAQSPENEISPLLLQEVGRNGNSCFGIFDGQQLANYVFMYATSALMTDELQVTFGPQYAYLCMTFTHPKHRGQHLNSIAVSMAAKEYLNSGFQSLLAYVESHNFSSLRSLHRIGWKEIGTVYIARVLGRYMIHVGAGCNPYKFRVAPLNSQSCTGKSVAA